MKALRIYSIALGMAAIMFAGCSGTYLDLTPEMQNVLNNYYKDAEQLRKGVNSAYGITHGMKFRQMIMVIMGNWTCSR